MGRRWRDIAVGFSTALGFGSGRYDTGAGAWDRAVDQTLWQYALEQQSMAKSETLIDQQVEEIKLRQARRDKWSRPLLGYLLGISAAWSLAPEVINGSAAYKVIGVTVSVGYAFVLHLFFRVDDVRRERSNQDLVRRQVVYQIRHGVPFLVSPAIRRPPFPIPPDEVTSRDWVYHGGKRR